MFSRETVLIISWLALPAPIKDLIRDDHRFGNDRLLEYLSELSPADASATWADTLSNDQAFHDYYEDQCETNHYENSFETFINEYGLTFDWWLKDQPVDLTGVHRILIHISW